MDPPMGEVSDVKLEPRAPYSPRTSRTPRSSARSRGGTYPRRSHSFVTPLSPGHNIPMDTASILSDSISFQSLPQGFVSNRAPRGGTHRAARHSINHLSGPRTGPARRPSKAPRSLFTPEGLPELPALRAGTAMVPGRGSPWAQSKGPASAGGSLHMGQIERRLQALPVVVCRGAENFFLVPTNLHERDRVSQQALQSWWPSGMLHNPDDIQEDEGEYNGKVATPERLVALPPLLSLDEQVERVAVQKRNKRRWRSFIVQLRARKGGWHPSLVMYQEARLKAGVKAQQAERPSDSPESMPDLREDLSALDPLPDHFPSNIALRMDTPTLEPKFGKQDDSMLDWRQTMLPEEMAAKAAKDPPAARRRTGTVPRSSSGAPPAVGPPPPVGAEGGGAGAEGAGAGGEGGAEGGGAGAGGMPGMPGAAMQLRVDLDSDDDSDDARAPGASRGGGGMGPASTAGFWRREPWQKTGADEYLRACESEGCVAFSHLLVQLQRGEPTLVLRGFVGELSELKGVRALAACLKANNVAGALVLENNSLGPRGAEVLAEALDKNATISHLDLSKNRIGDNGCRAIAPLLDERRVSSKHSWVPHLVELNISECGVRDAGARAIAEALTGEGSIANTVLKVLRIRGNAITDAAAPLLSEILSQSAHLEELDLAWNRLSARGVTLLLKGLLDNGSSIVRTLDLSWNGLGDGIGEVAGELLRGNSSLRDLDFSHTRLGSEACYHIASGLTANHSLVSLQLNGNAIGGDGGRFLNEAIAINDTLEMLGLKGCSFGPSLGPVAEAGSKAGGEVRGIARPPPAGRRASGAGQQGAHGGRGGGLALTGDGSDEKETTIDPEDLNNILTQLEEPQLADFERLLLLRMMGGTYNFTALQAQEVLFRGWGVSPSSEKTQAAMLLFTRLVDAENVDKIMCQNFMESEKATLKMELMGYAFFRRQNATGHYRIDWSVKIDRMIGTLVLQLDRQNILRGFPSGIRNVVANGKDALSLPATWADNPPDAGTLLMDFVATMQLLPPGAGGAHDDAQFKEFMHDCVGPENLSTEEKLMHLRGQSPRVRLRCDQLAELVDFFAWSDERVEVVVIFYARLCDRENFFKVLLAMGPMEQAAVGYRLGWASTFSPDHPSGHYALDCRLPRDCEVAKAICALACEDSNDGDRQNMHNVIINGVLKPNPLERSDKQLWTWVMEAAKLRTRKDEVEWLEAGHGGGDDMPFLEFDFFGDDCWAVMECQDIAGRERGARDAAIEMHARRLLILRSRCLHPYWEVFIQRAKIPQKQTRKPGEAKQPEALTTRGAAAQGQGSRTSGDGGGMPKLNLGAFKAAASMNTSNMIAMLQAKVAQQRLQRWREKRAQKLRWGQSAFMRSWYDYMRRVVMLNNHAEVSQGRLWNPIRMIFDLMDDDGSGSLELIELARGLMKVMGSESMDAAKQIESAIGDGDGVLDFEEFTQLIMERVDASVRVSNKSLGKDKIEKDDLLALLFGANVPSSEL